MRIKGINNFCVFSCSASELSETQKAQIVGMVHKMQHDECQDKVIEKDVG